IPLPQRGERADGSTAGPRRHAHLRPGILRPSTPPPHLARVLPDADDLWAGPGRAVSTSSDTRFGPEPRSAAFLPLPGGSRRGGVVGRPAGVPSAGHLFAGGVGADGLVGCSLRARTQPGGGSVGDSHTRALWSWFLARVVHQARRPPPRPSRRGSARTLMKQVKPH